MEKFPNELLEMILIWLVRMSPLDKPQVSSIRLVCKAFDEILRPYVLKTIKMNLGHLLKDRPTPDKNILPSIGCVCEALDLDMKLAREDDELSRLNNACQDMVSKVPEISPVLEELQSYSMSADTFDEMDFRRAVQDVLDNTPHLSRLKLGIPCSIFAKKCHTATIFLATVLDCLCKRPEGCKPLEIFVLDLLYDQTLIKICGNPMDLRNTLMVFSNLKSLVISLKRIKQNQLGLRTFNQHLWFVIRKAAKLENLCILGRLKSEDAQAPHHPRPHLKWQLRSLPYYSSASNSLDHLRTLSLRLISIRASSLIALVEETAPSLKELYLDKVRLQVMDASNCESTDMWIGLPNISRAENYSWVAEALVAIPDLNLDILRVTDLGYDIYEIFRPGPNSPPHLNYDIADPLDFGRTLDQRFVEAITCTDENSHQYSSTAPVLATPTQVCNTLTSAQPAPSFTFLEAALSDHDQSNSSTSTSGEHPTASSASSELPTPLATSTRAISSTLTRRTTPPPQPSRLNPLPKSYYDATTYQRLYHTPIQLSYCIDGLFHSDNQKTRSALNGLLTIIEFQTGKVSEEIARARLTRVEDGELVNIS